MKFLKTKIFIVFFIFGFNISFAQGAGRCDLTDTSKISSNPALQELIAKITEIIRRHEVLREKKRTALQRLDGLEAAGQYGIGADPIEEANLHQQVQEGTVAENKEYFRGEACDPNTYEQEVFSKVRNDYCRIDDAKSACQPVSISSTIDRKGAPTEKALDNMRVEEAMGFKANLERALFKVSENLSVTRAAVQKCEAALNSSLVSPSCQNAYTNAFGDLLQEKGEEIGERCTEGLIGGDSSYSLKSLFIESMRGFAQESCEVMQGHLANKALERQLYNRVQSLRATIHCLDHLGSEGCRNQHLGRNVAGDN